MLPILQIGTKPNGKTLKKRNVINDLMRPQNKIINEGNLL